MSAAQPGPGPLTEDSIFVDPFEPEYPGGDGKPMAESTLQYQWIVTIKEGIAALFADLRAEVQRERADAERERAERLAAMPRSMGVDPD